MTLEESLDRVPEHELIDALERRYRVRRKNAGPLLAMVAEIAKRHRVPAPLVLANCIDRPIVAARWELYRKLKAKGHTVAEIASITGHPWDRVHNALKKSEKIAAE